MRDDFANQQSCVAKATLPTFTDAFISYWIYMPTTSCWPSNMKTSWVLWYGASSPYADNDVIPGIQLGGTPNPTYDPSHNWSDQCDHCKIHNQYFANLYKLNAYKGQWYRISTYVHDDINLDGTGKVNTWVLSPGSLANTQTVNYTGAIMEDNTYLPNTFQLGYGNPDNNIPGCSEEAPRYDNVYLATGPDAQARVEIGNASTYASSTDLSIATITSWSDNSITATVRQGSFSNNSRDYLYVIDANGNVNASGYPITVGSTYSTIQTDTTPPAAPTGLKVT